MFKRHHSIPVFHLWLVILLLSTRILIAQETNSIDADRDSLVRATRIMRKLDPTNQTKDAGSPHPVIIYTHGGGWAAGSKQGIANGSQSTKRQRVSPANTG